MDIKNMIWGEIRHGLEAGDFGDFWCGAGSENEVFGGVFAIVYGDGAGIKEMGKASDNFDIFGFEIFQNLVSEGISFDIDSGSQGWEIEMWQAATDGWGIYEAVIGISKIKSDFKR